MTNIRIGDIVRFLTDRLEGKVTGLIDNKTVNVFVNEYGFEIPASVNDLVVIHTDSAAGTADTVTGGQHQKEVAIRPANTLYIAIVPENFNNLPESRYELFLVNDTDQTCLYSIAYRRENKYTGIIAGNCPPDNAHSLGTYTLKEIDNQIKAVHVQAVFFEKGTTQLKEPIDAEVKINGVSLCKAGAYKHARWFNAISLLRPLTKEEMPETLEADLATPAESKLAANKPMSEKQIREVIREKKSADQPAPVQHKPANSNVLEVDLHASEVLETTAGMDNKDILEYQLDIFHQTMEKYKLHKGQKIVFIHGKGDGVLRQRILWELQRKYKRHQHQDASFKQYGYGATLVTIK